jgi:putative transposase
MIRAIDKAHGGHWRSITSICKTFGLHRDAYYKFQRRYNKAMDEAAQVIALVKGRRKELPREGCRKLCVGLKEDIQALGIKLGRDKFFDLLRGHDMLVLRKRSFVRTTNSYHRFHKYGNLIKGLQVTAPNQVWVSDITYIRMIHGHCYLALITDAFSRKIVGYDVSDTLELAGCLRAFKRARRHVRLSQGCGLIHHSDRGIQYCSNQYVGQLIKHNIQISMTEENHCYENAMAERVNGILKDEFYLDQCFSNVDTAIGACKNAIKLYNTKRLHLSLDYKTPDEMFFKTM